MPNLKTLSAEEAIKALERLGFRRVRQRGSHVVMKKETQGGVVGCVVPFRDELKIGTLRGILKQAKVDPEEFLKQL